MDLDYIVFRALEIRRTLGVRKAAGFLRNQGVPLCEALDVLVYGGAY